MSVTFKTPEEIEILREGGRKLAEILEELKKNTFVGQRAIFLEELAIKLIKEKGAEPAFLNYAPEGRKAFPAAVCISVNDEIVHGVPHSHEEPFKEGDIVSLDTGIIYKGLITDSAITVGVGKIDAEAKKLLKATRESLDKGIKAAKLGNHIGDIGFAIENEAKKYGFSIAEGLAGHGVGYEIHEDPYVPNYGRPGDGLELKPGLVIAIEPMFCIGSGKIVTDKKDGFTIKTKDGKRSAHFEHTIAITEKGTVVLTRL